MQCIVCISKCSVRMSKGRQSSSLTSIGGVSLLADASSLSRGQQRAGEVTVNWYSHFSGSEMDSRAFCVPHDRETWHIDQLKPTHGEFQS